MSTPNPDRILSIIELPTLVLQLFERAQQPLLGGTQRPVGLFVRYLRRKPERGLAIIYQVSELGLPSTVRKLQASDPHHAVSLTLDESALTGSQIRFSVRQASDATYELQPPGILRITELGIATQAFPADYGLPALAASCDTTPDSPVFQALEAAARLLLKTPTLHLLSAKAIPVRYKPASRCVIRYNLKLEQASGAPLELAIFGKVYADPQQASTVQARMQLLYTEQSQSGQPMLPQPLGLIEALGLTLNEAIQPAPVVPNEAAAVMRTGTRAFQPQLVRDAGGAIARVIIPEAELRRTAEALARLHTSKVIPEGKPRTGAKEAKRARDRAALISARNPAQAAEVTRLASQLATRLEEAQPTAYRPAHGGFKASQLLFHSERVFVVDFDGFCLADPALDVGYFLAYLRPSGLWYQRAGLRQWFEAASAIFSETYRQAMLEHGVASEAVDAILRNVPLYEAALLFKIATRRANRLNSPRPGELGAMLQEIASCLEDETS